MTKKRTGEWTVSHTQVCQTGKDISQQKLEERNQQQHTPKIN